MRAIATWRFRLLAPVVALLATSLGSARAQTPAFGVFLNLVDSVTVSFGDAVTALRQGIGAAGWQGLTDYDVGVEHGDCAKRAHVFVVHEPAYDRAVLQRGAVAAFALPLRLAVYEDERGVHVGAVNPQSLNRTIVAESGFEAQSASAVEALRQMVGTTFPGHSTNRQYGQMRDHGLITKTMGIMAGGPFPGKVETVESVDLKPGESLSQVAQRLYAGLQRLGGTRRWGIRPVYLLDTSDQGIVIIGVTGTALEARAFHIVGAGGDDTRAGFACPGLDHAAAFPIELVLSTKGRQVTVTMIDAMFRMKMYFEDAGKMKFAANMTMPGSIGNEILDEIEESLH